MSRDRSLSVKLRADVSNYLAGVKQAGNATREFAGKAGEGVAQHKADWATVGQSVTVAGLAIAAGVGFAVSRFADFDAAMSAAAAATRASARDLGLLRDAAMQAGADTQYSASEAAQAITELGKAGVSTADILGGGLSGALDLASAGQLDVAKSAELAATAMTQFKLSGDQLPHVADLLAAGAGKAQGSVEDMGMALKQSGLVAKQTGLSIEETTGGLAAFASAGLIGSDAGTSFKSMLQRLTPQSKEAAALMEELGISAYDAQGNFIGLERFAGNLRESMQGLSVESRNSAMATIFGSDAVRAAAVLYDNGADGVRKWVSAVDDAGFAQETARRLTDNLRGDVERLGGAFDTALIQSGSALNGSLRSLVQTLESAVTGFTQLPGPVQSGVVQMAALTSGVLLVGGATMVTLPKVVSFKASVEALGLTAGRTGAALSLLGKTAGLLAVGAIATSVSDMGHAAMVADPAVERLASGLGDLGRGLKESRDLGELFAGGWGPLRNDVEKTDEAILNFANHARAALNPSMMDNFNNLFSGAAGKFEEYTRQLDAGFERLVKDGKADQAKAAFQRFSEAAVAQGVDVEQLAQKFPAYQAALDAAAAKNASAGAEIQTTSRAVESYLDKMRGATEQTKAYADALKGIASPILDAREAARQWVESVEAAENALRKNGRTLNDNTEAGRENARALDDMVKSAIGEIAAMQASGQTQVELQGKLETSRAKIEAMAVAFGMSAPEAKKYADQLLNIPTQVMTKIAADTTLAYRDIVALAQKLDSLRDRTIYIRTVTTAVNMDSSATGYNRATGGPIFGPGTATSDSIPAWLSNGEYVIRAAAVDKYGLGLMHQINAMRFADGGFVSRAAASQTPQPASPSLAGISVTGTLDTPWGPAQVRGVVRDEMSSVARVAQLRGR
jgi:TP901 family phage tail tape measure protein